MFLHLSAGMTFSGGTGGLQAALATGGPAGVTALYVPQIIRHKQAATKQVLLES
jgi:hypothetical protein